MLPPERYLEIGLELTVCPACGYRCPGSYHYCPACGAALLPPVDPESAADAGGGRPLGGLGAPVRAGPDGAVGRSSPARRLVLATVGGALVGAALGALAVWASRP